MASEKRTAELSLLKILTDPAHAKLSAQKHLFTSTDFQLAKVAANKFRVTGVKTTSVLELWNR